MKTKKTSRKAALETPALVMRETLCVDEPSPRISTGPMVRTQIYLSPDEHQFLQTEAARRGQPMAAVIRSFIDEKMNLPEAAWLDNPLLAPPADPDFVGPEDGVINHDHYIYGTPRRFLKRKGRWQPAPPLPEDYHLNEKSRQAYDHATGEES